jgi:DNA-binding protein HU-beta
MRKVDVVTKIADLTGIPKTDVLLTLEAFFREVKNQVKTGESVYVRGFGSFVPKKRAQKLGRLISKNETVVIPEHYIPAFKPAKSFAEQVRKYKPTPEQLEQGQVKGTES